MAVHMNSRTLSLTMGLTCLESHLTGGSACPDATVLGLGTGGYFQAWRDLGRAASIGLWEHWPPQARLLHQPCSDFQHLPRSPAHGRSTQSLAYITVSRAVEPVTGEAWLAEAGHWDRHLKILPAPAPAQSSLLCGPLPREQSSPHTHTSCCKRSHFPVLLHQGKLRYPDTMP